MLLSVLASKKLFDSSSHVNRFSMFVLKYFVALICFNVGRAARPDDDREVGEVGELDRFVGEVNRAKPMPIVLMR